MSRQLEQAWEEKRARREKLIVRAVEFELVGMFSGNGSALTGFSVKIAPDECLVTLRAMVHDVPSISFVGAEDLGGALVKAARMGKRDKLNWRVDDYAATQS